MDSTLRTLRVIYAAFLGSVIVFFLAGEVVNPPRSNELDIMLFPLSFIGIATLGLGVYLRKSTLGPARDALRLHPDDVGAVAAWRRGNVLAFVFAESVAMFGLMVRFVTGSRELAWPFLIAGGVALVLWAPKRPDA
jgi:hypothetical protein